MKLRRRDVANREQDGEYREEHYPGDLRPNRDLELHKGDEQDDWNEDDCGENSCSRERVIDTGEDVLEGIALHGWTNHNAPTTT